MVIKLDNKAKEFYGYMGRFFGSRVVEKQMNDRMYDDDGKEWYIFVDEGTAKAFVSIQKETIKNVYTTKEEYLKEILIQIKQERPIGISIVPKIYENIYSECGLEVSIGEQYKNFVVVTAKEN